MTPADADAAVARGARVLDARGPAGWREIVRAAIRDGRLDMRWPYLVNGCGCLLVHVYGRYGYGLSELGDDGTVLGWPEEHGFTVGRNPPPPNDPWDDLAAAWARLLGAGIRRRFGAVRGLLVAADRIRDRWADGDAAVKRQLWADLHTRADELREALS